MWLWAVWTATWPNAPCPRLGYSFWVLLAWLSAQGEVLHIVHNVQYCVIRRFEKGKTDWLLRPLQRDNLVEMYEKLYKMTQFSAFIFFPFSFSFSAANLYNLCADFLYFNPGISVKKFWPFERLCGSPITRISTRTWSGWWGRSSLCWMGRSEWVIFVLFDCHLGNILVSFHQPRHVKSNRKGTDFKSLLKMCGSLQFQKKKKKGWGGLLCLIWN